MDYQQIAAQLRKPEGDLGRKMGENMNASNRIMNLEAIRLMGIEPGDKVLEIGMGNGFFCKEVTEAKAGVTYTGCDFSPDMIDEANRLNQSLVASGKAEFVLGDVGQLPFGDTTFDKIFTVNTIYFWENPDAVLREINRVLKPGGNFIIAFRPKEIMLALPFSQYGFTLYTGSEVADLLFNNLFRVHSIQKISEPDYEIAGATLAMASVVVVAEK